MQCNHIDLNIIESDTAGQTDPQLYGIHPCLSSMGNLNMCITRDYLEELVHNFPARKMLVYIHTIY